ncbi:hypothetical protein CBS101457_001427 [Exobasidium rhododendri]|nr:hypothetical protein CBS101457_001427 [Exobasidium rhododendri]
MQFFVSLLVAAQVFVIVFSTTWASIRQLYWMPEVRFGRCQAVRPIMYHVEAFPGYSYARDPFLWLYVVTITFNLVCLVIALVALRLLAINSTGFSKFINGMRNHSLFFFAITFLLSVLAIVWRGLQSVAFIYQPITMIEAAVMVRILLAEQDAARRPLDTTHIDNGHAAGASRYRSTRGQLPTTQQHTIPRGDPTIQFLDRLQNQDYLHYQQQLFQQQQQQQQHQNQQYPFLPRPIHQPQSIMDNLGQAFSQVDSRNPQDLEEQSLDLSRSSSSNQVLNEYPGVVQEELERRQREDFFKREIELNNLKNSNNVREEEEEDEELSTRGSVRSTGAHPAEESDSGSESEVENRREQNVPPTVSANRSPTIRIQRPLSLYSTSDRNYFVRRSQHLDDDEDDDEEIGTQTVQF